jgi:hypothetical protein
MSAYEADIQYAVSVLDGHDQAIVVSLDIEYDSVVDEKAGIPVDVLDVRGRIPFGTFRVVIPRL